MKQIVSELKNKVNDAGLMSVMYAFSTALISGTVLNDEQWMVYLFYKLIFK